MCVRDLVLQNGFYVLASVFQDELGTTGMALKEVGDIVDLGANGDIARLFVVVLAHLGGRNRRKGATGHGGGCRHELYSKGGRFFAVRERREVIVK
jgi:hypothetical protein